MYKCGELLEEVREGKGKQANRPSVRPCGKKGDKIRRKYVHGGRRGRIKKKIFFWKQLETESRVGKSRDAFVIRVMSVEGEMSR